MKKDAKSKNAKDLILEKTFLLLLEKGYGNVSVSDIQKKLGMSRGLLYRYFKDKSDLMFNACGQYFLWRYFSSDIDYDKITMGDFVRHIMNSQKELIDLLGKRKGAEVSIIDYNRLYVEVVSCEEKFRALAIKEIGRTREIILKAMEKGEISKRIPLDFVESTFQDIWGRVVFLSPEDAMNDEITFKTLRDIAIFYNLIKSPKVPQVYPPAF